MKHVCLEFFFLTQTQPKNNVIFHYIFWDDILSDGNIKLYYSELFINLSNWSFKMLYLIGPTGLVNLGYVNFWKLKWMTMVRDLRFRINHQKLSEVIQGGDYIRFKE